MSVDPKLTADVFVMTLLNEPPLPPAQESITRIVGECEIYKEERDALEEMRKLEVCDVEEFGRLESSEKTIAIRGDRWWPQTAEQDKDRISKQFSMQYIEEA